MSVVYIIASQLSQGGTATPPPPPAELTNPTLAYGDSITLGLNASPFANSWRGLMETAKSITTNDFTGNGGGVEYMCKRMNQYLGVGNQQSAVLAAGLNDLQRSGNATYNLNKLRGCYRHALSSLFMESFVRGDDTTQVTITGAYNVTTRTDSATASRSEYNGGALRIVEGNAATVSYTFSGDHIGVMFYHFPVGLLGGQFNVYIDGAFVEFINTHEEAGGATWTDNGAFIPTVKIYEGLSSGSHTIELRTQAINGNNTVQALLWLDGFFTLQDPSTAPLAVMGSPCYMMQERYDYLAGAFSVTLTDAVIDQYGRDLMFEIADEFIARGYNVGKVDQNKYYRANSTNTDTADYTHPNNTGHGLVWQAWSEVLP
jgi:hypothetical protein